jgi:hypothetical protein
MRFLPNLQTRLRRTAPVWATPAQSTFLVAASLRARFSVGVAAGVAGVAGVTCVAASVACVVAATFGLSVSRIARVVTGVLLAGILLRGEARVIGVDANGRRARLFAGSSQGGCSSESKGENEGLPIHDLLRRTAKFVFHDADCVTVPILACQSDRRSFA